MTPALRAVLRALGMGFGGWKGVSLTCEVWWDKRIGLLHLGKGHFHLEVMPFD